MGGFTQGIGMALAGACPGMAYAQLGVGSSSASYVYVGGVLGAFGYRISHPLLKEYHTFDFVKTLQDRCESMHLERVFFNGRFKSVAVAFVVLGPISRLFI